MQIYGPTHVHGPQQVSAPHSVRAAEATQSTSSVRGGDEVAISDAGQLLAQIRDLPEMRMDRVAELRAAIAGGAYETDDKLDAALENLLDEIG
ncbi:MAG: flagellar biosynthesis anti-sigma factor FlgM [Pirellulales bacterium]|nr:flagellar biosynthesis anti-sigma factor FlgM [Pirellulales bacterium]